MNKKQAFFLFLGVSLMCVQLYTEVMDLEEDVMFFEIKLHRYGEQLRDLRTPAPSLALFTNGSIRWDTSPIWANSTGFFTNVTNAYWSSSINTTSWVIYEISPEPEMDLEPWDWLESRGGS